MPFNINNFKQQGLVLGGARPALFQVRMTGIPVTVPGGLTNQLSFLCQSASLPASRTETIEIPYYGRRIRIAGARTFEDWRVTVMNDEDFGLRDMFEAWSNKINALVSNRQNSNPGNLMDYKIDSVEVLQYGKIGPNDDTGVIRSYIFGGMFPVRVDEIGLDWRNGDDIERFDVQFAYDYWTPTTIGHSTPSYSGYLPPDSSNIGLNSTAVQ